jgi:hypothetical protein
MKPRNPRAVVVLRRGPWWPHAVQRPLQASIVSNDALAQTVWRERALVVGRLDQQCAARFAEALADLIDIAELLALGTRIALAGEGAVVMVRRRL